MLPDSASPSTAVTTLKLVSAAVLMGWMFVAMPWLDALSAEMILVLWGVTWFGGVVLLMTVARNLVVAKGYLWSRDRPAAGIAGRAWGILLPSVFVPLTSIFLLVFSIVFLWTGRYLSAAFFLVFGSILLGSYLKMTSLRSSRRAALQARADDADYSRLARSAEGSAEAAQVTEALQVIARVIRVAPEKLRRTDRFGHEVGTFAAFDETLDELGGRLLKRKRQLRTSLALDGVRTVGDFLDQWQRPRADLRD